jgi:hypothetical protein
MVAIGAKRMSSISVAELMKSLKYDTWRDSSAFSADLKAANEEIFQVVGDESRAEEILNDWLAKNQPCLFGRMAAQLGALHHCILWENELLGDERHIRDKIQKARTKWTQDGFTGSSSGFVITAISPKLTTAVPDETVRKIAQRLCSFYLLREIEPDVVYHDEIWLEKPGNDRTTWKWLAGVNYFSATGDGRWWHDHRIPGGMAFSTNSVGHLIKSGLLEKGVKQLDELMGVDHEKSTLTKLSSLQEALVLAMKTINKASNAVSGRATELLPLKDVSSTQASSSACPFHLPADIANKDPRYYKGYYHTDITVPSEYFQMDVERPAHCKAQTLEFTYLFDQSFDNPDYITMGLGRQVRGDNTKSTRIKETEVSIDDSPRLAAALQGSL